MARDFAGLDHIRDRRCTKEKPRYVIEDQVSTLSEKYARKLRLFMAERAQERLRAQLGVAQLEQALGTLGRPAAGPASSTDACGAASTASAQRAGVRAGGHARRQNGAAVQPTADDGAYGRRLIELQSREDPLRAAPGEVQMPLLLHADAERHYARIAELVRHVHILSSNGMSSESGSRRLQRLHEELDALRCLMPQSDPPLPPPPRQTPRSPAASPPVQSGPALDWPQLPTTPVAPATPPPHADHPLAGAPALHFQPSSFRQAEGCRGDRPQLGAGNDGDEGAASAVAPPVGARGGAWGEDGSGGLSSFTTTARVETSSHLPLGETAAFSGANPALCGLHAQQQALHDVAAAVPTADCGGGGAGEAAVVLRRELETAERWLAAALSTAERQRELIAQQQVSGAASASCGSGSAFTAVAILELIAMGG